MGTRRLDTFVGNFRAACVERGLCGTCVDQAVYALRDALGAHPVEGSGLEGAGGEPPRRCICGHDGCGYTTCPDCPTHGDEWPKSFKHRVAPAALGSRPSVITAPDAPAAKRPKS